MKFQKGQSGNPSGRPPLTLQQREAKAIAREHAERAIAKIVSLIDSTNERISLMAAQDIVDRAWGKATQTLAGDQDNPVALRMAEAKASFQRKLQGIINARAETQ